MPESTDKLPYELPTLPDGRPNPKYIDFLQSDPPIPGQVYTCCSFISPESVVKSADMFYFEKYVQQFGVEYFAEIMHTFIMFVKDKYKLNPDSIKSDLDDFISSEKELSMQLNVHSLFMAYKKQHEAELREEYKMKNPMHKCTVRSFKVRGVYGTQEMAEAKSAEFRALEPSVSTFVGNVGMWQVFDPTGATNVKFLEPELNEIYSERLVNQRKAEEAFQERVRTEKLAAFEANKETCKKVGVKPTQMLDEDGNLINTAITQETIDARDEALEEGTLAENLKRLEELMQKEANAVD